MKLPTTVANGYNIEEQDWLVENIERKAEVYRGKHEQEMIMSNGLISRMWRLAPNAATVAFDNLMTNESIIRGVKPEAILEIDSQKYEVGGLVGQEEYAYLKHEWLDSMTANPKAFQFIGFEIGETKARFPWKRKRYSEDLPWPAPGVSLTLHFTPPEGELEGVEVQVHYEMYDGIPLLCKWLTIHNKGRNEVKLNHFVSEILAVVECESPVENPVHWAHPNIHVESDYSFHGMMSKVANETTHWVTDPQYTTQVNYDCLTPVMLESRPKIGPGAVIHPGKTFETFRTFELIFDSTEQERKGLAKRRMYRTVAPWVTENPIFMHVLSDQPDEVRTAIDQCVEVGYEMVVLSFGSGFNMESEDPSYILQMRELADYAHSKGIELGGYSLLASRTISEEDDVVNPNGVMYVHSPCLGSRWGQKYFQKLKAFFEQTGFDLLEHDGSYPGDICESITHPGHRGKDDSQWTQWKTISDFYNWCRSEGVYLNVPDWYFFTGSNKAGMGYREVNWALPRDRQILLARQNIYDGTWEKTPSMGWMFVSLTEYHGGGPASTMEPLSEHLETYDQHLMNNFTSGVQASYRGFRLYDTEETKQVVKKWVDFHKKYRAILDSDIIHVRRPDGRNIDCIMHVNPQLEYKGLVVVHNPLDEPVDKQLKLSLYYTGLTDVATIREKESEEKCYKIDRHYNVILTVQLAAKSSTWFLIT